MSLQLAESPVPNGHTVQAHSSRTDRPANLSTEETRAYVSGYARGCTAYGRKHGFPVVSTVSGALHDTDIDAEAFAAGVDAQDGRALASFRIAAADARTNAHTARVAALDVPALSALTREHEADRHPSAHKAGLSSLARYRKRYGIVAPAAVKPRKAPVKRRALAVVPVPAESVPAPTEAPVPVVAPVPVPVTVTVPAPALSVGPMPATRAARKAWRRELAATMRAAGIDPRGQAWEDAIAANV